MKERSILVRRIVLARPSLRAETRNGLVQDEVLFCTGHGATRSLNCQCETDLLNDVVSNNVKPNPKRRPATKFTKDSYRKAVTTAAKRQKWNTGLHTNFATPRRQ